MTLKKKIDGYTLIELLIVFAIIGLITAVVLPSFIDFRRSSLLNTNTTNLVTLINRARILSVSAKNDSQYGVHLEAGKAVLFQGATYDVNAPTNEVYNFDAGLELSSIIINNGTSEILFDKITGDTDNNATTTLLITGTNASSTVLVRPTGSVTIN